MDHVRPFPGLDQKLQGGLGERGETLDIVVMTVDAVATEETLARMRIDEEALSPVHVPEPHRARQFASIPGSSQILVADMKVPHLLFTHARVPRQHDLDRVPPDLEFA